MVPILRLGRRYVTGVRLTTIPLQVQEQLHETFTRLHEVFLRTNTKLLIVYTQVEDEHRLYLLAISDSLDRALELQDYLRQALEHVPGLRTHPVCAIDLEIVLDFLKRLDLKYCIIGPVARLPDYCTQFLVLLVSLDRIDILNRMSMLEHALKTTVRVVLHTASTRSIELTSRDHVLVKIQHELSRLRRGLTEGTWLGIVLADTAPGFDAQEGDSALEPGRHIRVLKVDAKTLDNVRKLKLPQDLTADPDIAYVPSPKYLTYLTSSEIANLILPSPDKPGLAVNLILPPRLSSQGRDGELYLCKVLDINLHPVADMYISLRDFCHVGVFGTTGSGKTVTAQRIAAEFVRCGGRVVVLDWKFEWRRLLRLSMRSAMALGIH